MKGVDVSFANALRRIMIAEVPTVAIEHVYMWNNSSIVHDEVLAHRLGLVPIHVDPRLFEDFAEEEEEPTDRNTVVFKLGVSCGRSKEEDDSKNVKDDADAATASASNNDNGQPQLPGNDFEIEQLASESAQHYRSTHPSAAAAASAIETPGRPYTKHVYSRDLEWVPQGDQSTRFTDHRQIKPVHPDILLAKLRPGQVIELEAHARRGVGKDHAKFSPVATAAYRLMPHVELIQNVYDDKAEELANLYEPGVFGLETVGPEDPVNTKIKAVVKNSYACTMSRNYMRDPVLKEAVKITRIPNHFIFSIESVGMMSPGVILAEALRVLQSKCQNLMRLLDEQTGLQGDHENDIMDEEPEEEEEQE
mmetsp:Transcript_6375/g.9258  ORF Transcript_6375/g.9258 Transcript_6375/m.9258 type:complete len:364 (+) Transcript_6375:182-1273(+)